jgi:hypothetical protein
MAGLVPAIHVLLPASEPDVDARDERGHDESPYQAAFFDSRNSPMRSSAFKIFSVELA